MISVSGDSVERASKNVYLFTFNGNKRLERTNDLESPIMSIYSPFTFSSPEEQNFLFMINEDEAREDPEVVKYHVVPTIL